MDGDDLRPGVLFDLNLPSLGFELGSGVVIGAVVGFAAKKIAKVIAVLIGLELALFKFLESRQILHVNWSKLTAGLVGVADDATAQTPPSWVSTILSTLSVSVGFTGGFYLGFRKG